jgi:hypothetical protein
MPRPRVTVPREAGVFPPSPAGRRDERAGFAVPDAWPASLPLASASASSLRGGSNVYAIRTRNGAILNNSPQLGFSIPELFVEIEVHAPRLSMSAA